MIGPSDYREPEGPGRSRPLTSSERLPLEERLHRCEAERDRLKSGIRELRKRFEHREDLHTSDFTAALLALEESDNKP